MGQVGLELTPIWNVGFAGGGLAHYATMLMPEHGILAASLDGYSERAI